VSVAGVAGGDAGVAPGPSALERVSSVDDAFAGDAEVAQSVIFLLVARVGHRGHPRPLLRQTEEVGPLHCLHRLRPAVVRAAVSHVEVMQFL